VRWNSESGANSGGLLETFEHLTLGAAFPNPSCAIDWATAASNQRVDFFELGNGLYDDASVAFFRTADGATSQKTVDICFTPRGRTHIRDGITGAFTALSGAPRYDVSNTATPNRDPRKVFVPPNGIARLAL
jgi:type IV fimbrial biogenesis protein FimT